jgi:archaellin
MKQLYQRNLLLAFILLLAFQRSGAQVNLPYTLHFSMDNPANWSDGIAQDGDGGTSNINGLDIQIYAADASFNKLAGSTIVWHDNAYYFSGTAGYTAITPGPDATVTSNGVPAMVLKSSSQAVNFSLQSIQLYDWGGVTPIRMASYNNGTLVGMIDVSLDNVNWNVKTISQSDALTPALFNNIDEIRFYPSPSSGSNAIYLSMNNISLASPAAVMPVTLTYFKGRTTSSHSAVLEWETAQEENADHFEIEQSSNGNQFTKLASVPAKGNSSIATRYQYNFTGTVLPMHYFRLKEVDQDGKSSYSSIISISNDVTVGSVLIFPNPAAGGIASVMASTRINNITVFSSSGAKIKTVPVNGNGASLQLNSLARGTYYLQLELQGKTEKRTLVVN